MCVYLYIEYDEMKRYKTASRIQYTSTFRNKRMAHFGVVGKASSLFCGWVWSIRTKQTGRKKIGYFVICSWAQTTSVCLRSSLQPSPPVPQFNTNNNNYTYIECQYENNMWQNNPSTTSAILVYITLTAHISGKIYTIHVRRYTVLITRPAARLCVCVHVLHSIDY